MSAMDTFTLAEPAAEQAEPEQHQHQSLRQCVEHALRAYFADLDGQPTSDLYNMVLAEVEAPLLEAVMDYTRNNQSKTAEMLGLNRGTLRKKLKQYDLL
jgi:Fis family transcriptional regulator